MEGQQELSLIEQDVGRRDVITPAIEILTQNSISTASLPPSIARTLDEMFPEQVRGEKTIKQAREVLGTLADNFTSDQLKDVVTEIQFLTGTWLDDFERRIFQGVTLKELLHEKGGRA